MSTAKLAEEIKRLLPEEKYKRIRLAIMRAATAGRSEARTVKDEIAQENRLRTGVLADGTIEFTSDTSAELDLFAWVIDYVIHQPGPVTKAVVAPHAVFARPDYFVGMPDGTIDYRPGTVDDLGNVTFPNVAADEVLLRAVSRNPDGSDEPVTPPSPADPRYPDTEYYTVASPADSSTAGLYAPVWQATIRPNDTFILQLAHGSPSDSSDWSAGDGGRASMLNLAVYCQAGLAVTGIHFETFGGGAQDADWVLQRVGDQITLYHRSVAFYMRVKFRILFLCNAANKSQFLQGSAYAALPAVSDQQFSSKLFGGAAGTNQDTKFLSGGFWVYSGTGLIFDTVLTEMQFPGSNEIISIPGTRIDLADFPELDNDTDPQFVRPVWNRAGQVVPLFGPASSDPQVPSVSDPVTELAGDPILLSAGETSIPPVQIQTGVIFAEGAAGEATLGHSGAGTSNFASTSSPISGSISVEVTNAQNGTTTNATPPAPVTVADFTAVAIKVRLKAVMAPGHNLGIFFRKSGAIVSKTRMLPIDKNSLSVQVLGIPLSQFESSAATVDQIVLRWYRSSGAAIHPGYFFDDWILQGGVQPPPVASDGVRSVTGDGVGGTAKEVVLTFPTPAQIGAVTADDLDPIISDLDDLENQVQDIEMEVDDHEDRIDALESAPGGGADSNAVHYNAADGKNATEKQQARDNIGLPTGVPTIMTLAASVNTLLRPTNLIVFEGHTAIRSILGMVAGEDGERCSFWNRGEYNLRVSESIAAAPENRFNFSPVILYEVLPGELIEFSYNATQQRWNFATGFEKYIRKDIAEIKYFGLEIKPAGGAATNSLAISSGAGRTIITGTRNGSHLTSLRFDNNSLYMGNDKGSAAIFGVHIEANDTVHLGKTGNGTNTALPTGYQVASNVGHYFYADASFFGRTDRLLSITTAGAVNDLDTTGMSNVRLTAATVLTGIMAPAVIGKRLTIQNDNSVPLDIPHQSTASIAANRLNLIGASTLSVPPKGKVHLIYCTGSRWELDSKNF